MANTGVEEFLQLDTELIDEFMACYRDAREEIHQCIQTLSLHNDSASINTLFRAMHSLKGNCRMVYLDPYVDSLHELEEIVSDLRDMHIEYTSSMGDFFVEATECIHDQLVNLVRTRAMDTDGLDLLTDWVQKVRSPEAVSSQDIYLKAAASLRGEGSEPVSTYPTLPVLPGDLDLMQQMAQRLDALSIYRRGRLEQIQDLARLLNEALNCPVDASQLTAAVYMHDLGMAFVPHGIFNKEGNLSREELRMIQAHVDIGYLLLRRMEHWDDAATMVLHHHERHDGQGYPQRLVGQDIHIGGCILALVDTYCSITNERSDRNFKRSLLSAITEINSSKGMQFDPEMVEVFNEVVRTHLLKR
ncbi:MAG: HD domain-containing protein [Pseudomonadales bacterium]|nr:HD domain-containing protein [Pseudomonadales bacterium]